MTPAQIELLISGGGVESPCPFDGADGISSKLLRWATGADAVSSNVYIGTNETALASATTASPEYKASITLPGYMANLSPLTTYYWRIDTVTPTTTLTGPVWSFTTAATLDDINNGIITHLTMDNADISGNTVKDVSGTPIYNGTKSGVATGATGHRFSAGALLRGPAATFAALIATGPFAVGVAPAGCRRAILSRVLPAPRRFR